MIALVVGDLNQGPIPLALEREGVEARKTASVEQAEWDIQNEGEDGCVLVLDASALEEGGPDWGDLLERYPALPAVALRGDGGMRLGECKHRIALAEAFDAAAVVTAVRRATARAPEPAHEDEDSLRV